MTEPESSPSAIRAIDSHCHLDQPRFDEDRDEVIRRAVEAGVTRMVTIGASDGMVTNRAAVALAAQYDCVFATVGIHPHDAKLVDDAVLAELRDLARSPRVVAIGETGLDYYYDNSPREQQRDAFRKFLQLCRDVNLPCVIHLRDAYDDAVEIMKDEKAAEIGGVIHCFSGDRENARAFLDLGFDLSFSGIVTFKNADELRAVARMVPDDRFLIETDAPFLAPIPYRGKRNEPAYVLQTAAAIAAVRGTTSERIAAIAAANTCRTFRLPPD